MQALEWSDSFLVGLPVLDDAHREFVRLLAQAHAAPDRQLMAAWSLLLIHCEMLFDQEDAWMESTGYAAAQAHRLQHRIVLQLFEEGLRRGERADLGVVRQMTQALATWFPRHVRTLDMGLASHLRRVGYAPLADGPAPPPAP